MEEVRILSAKTKSECGDGGTGIHTKADKKEDGTLEQSRNGNKKFPGWKRT